MLTVKTLRGASWSVAARMSSRIIDLATLLILARVLTPADFGLIAIALSLVSIIEMVLEVPLVQALMRLPKIEKSHLDTAFTLSLLRGGVTAFLMFTAAWPVAYIFQDARLTVLIMVLAVGVIVRGLPSPTMVHFFRDLDFRVSFIVEFLGKIIASIFAVIILYVGGGYWALVCNSVISAVVPTAISYIIAPYKPRLSMEKLRDFSAFTGWFTSSQIVTALSWQYDRVLLGYNVDKSVLGQYSLASDFSVIPSQSLIGPAMRPVMAAFASIAADRQRLHSAFLKAAKLTMFIALPTGIGIALTSEQIISVILGPQWISTAVYLKWLSLSVAITTYYQPVYALCLAIDKPNLLWSINIFELITKVPLITLALYIDGLQLMLYTRVFSAVLLFVISAIFAYRVLGISIALQLYNLWQVGISCVAMTFSVFILQKVLQRSDIGSIGTLTAMMVCGVLVYAGCMHALGFRLRTMHQ